MLLHNRCVRRRIPLPEAFPDAEPDGEEEEDPDDPPPQGIGVRRHGRTAGMQARSDIVTTI